MTTKTTYDISQLIIKRIDMFSPANGDFELGRLYGLKLALEIVKDCADDEYELARENMLKVFSIKH